ncbi:hypothetical protein CFAM422_007172 [Trichoderma lentiforme]|uniref:Uncharacterized protein n=1 Tax=Trichoderma lentiforme TaxID=1567552 RepID=A0A9P4XE95_9HYPO|nr:hypothetical protein CFAM422_007172 [Trichoderma lentiforme]
MRSAVARNVVLRLGPTKGLQGQEWMCGSSPWGTEGRNAVKGPILRGPSAATGGANLRKEKPAEYGGLHSAAAG